MPACMSGVQPLGSPLFLSLTDDKHVTSTISGEDKHRAIMLNFAVQSCFPVASCGLVVALGSHT